MQNSFASRVLNNFVIRDQQIKFNKNAMQIAQKLDECTKGLSTDDQMFCELFTTTTQEDYQSIIDAYQKLTGEQLYDRLRGEFVSQDLEIAQLCHLRFVDFKQFVNKCLRNKANPSATIVIRDRLDWSGIAVPAQLGELLGI